MPIRVYTPSTIIVGARVRHILTGREGVVPIETDPNGYVQMGMSDVLFDGAVRPERLHHHELVVIVPSPLA